MFFILSKVLLFLIQPFNWVLTCIVLSLTSQSATRKKKYIIGALGLLLFFSNPFLINLVETSYAPAVVPLAEVGYYDNAIVLGSYSDPAREPQDRVYFNQEVNRLTDAIMLYKAGKVKNLVLSGGTGKLIGKKGSESYNAKLFIDAIGIPDSAILLEGNSKNTYENCRNLLELHPTIIHQKNLLITSNYHMPRSSAIFKKQGLPHDIFPTSHQTSYEWTPGSVLIPSLGAISRWSQFIREWVGLVAYKAKGYL